MLRSLTRTERPVARRHARPTVSLATRLSLEDDARRRRLQQLTGDKVPVLIARALQLLEHALNSAGGNRASKTELPPAEEHRIT